MSWSKNYKEFLFGYNRLCLVYIRFSQKHSILLSVKILSEDSDFNSKIKRTFIFINLSSKRTSMLFFHVEAVKIKNSAVLFLIDNSFMVVCEVDKRLCCLQLYFFNWFFQSKFSMLNSYLSGNYVYKFNWPIFPSLPACRQAGFNFSIFQI